MPRNVGTLRDNFAPFPVPKIGAAAVLGMLFTVILLIFYSGHMGFYWF
jgi:hypothetical protein